MVKRRTNFFYVAALLIIIGIGGFVMPLIRHSEIIVFSWMGAYALIGKIVCLALGGVALVIGFIRYFTGPRPEAEKRPDQPPPQDKQNQ
ncbi:MAG: hypothetical protein JXD23_00310 [Spirochaetales bacterium]|nr:hypothetical protein [Spirochaetales bacterium]